MSVTKELYEFFDFKPCQSVSFVVAEAILLHSFLLNFFLTCSSFFIIFSLSEIIKLFLKQKLKSSMNLNHRKESKRKQLLRVLILGRKTYRVWGSFPWAICQKAIMSVTNHPKDNFPLRQLPGGYYQGSIIFRVIVREQ